MKVGVIMGGLSTERDVSLMTGKEMLAHLDRSQYEITSIDIHNRVDWINEVRGLDLALLALHGQYGEDGTVQGTLEALGIPYTGSGVLSSSLCMNKDMSKKLLRSEGVRTPNWQVISDINDIHLPALMTLGLPLVVKPNCGGSSIGVVIVRKEEELIPAIRSAFEIEDEVLVERYISGQEISCSILNGQLLPVISIDPLAEFFDYTSKYVSGQSNDQVIELEPEIHAAVEQASLDSYHALQCSVYARVDMILQDGVPYVMEVNTLPGMTPTSLLPLSASAAGITFTSLLDNIIEGSFRKYSQRKLSPLSDIT